MANWQRVASIDDVWSDVVVAASAGPLRLVLVRSGEDTPEDRICAYRDACPHEKFPLSEWGQLEKGVIVCQRHFWEFDAGTGKHITRIERPNCNLTAYAVKVDGADVFVDVDSVAESTPDQPTAGA